MPHPEMRHCLGSAHRCCPTSEGEQPSLVLTLVTPLIISGLSTQTSSSCWSEPFNQSVSRMTTSVMTAATLLDTPPPIPELVPFGQRAITVSSSPTDLQEFLYIMAALVWWPEPVESHHSPMVHSMPSNPWTRQSSQV